MKQTHFMYGYFGTKQQTAKIINPDICIWGLKWTHIIKRLEGLFVCLLINITWLTANVEADALCYVTELKMLQSFE